MILNPVTENPFYSTYFLDKLVSYNGVIYRLLPDYEMEPV